mmetsp:Transcript_46813/g.54713  ORF Transcript_46813/g.54713 Transcript_46813/m.54713 type:complete len:109 (+) Transcript_46813:505-831(+)
MSHELLDILHKLFLFFECLQHSTFYDNSKLSTHSWYLRWMTFEGSTVSSVPNRDHAESKEKNYPGFNEVIGDEEHKIIVLSKKDESDAICTFKLVCIKSQNEMRCNRC